MPNPIMPNPIMPISHKGGDRALMADVFANISGSPALNGAVAMPKAGGQALEGANLRPGAHMLPSADQFPMPQPAGQAPMDLVGSARPYPIGPMPSEAAARDAAMASRLQSTPEQSMARLQGMYEDGQERLKGRYATPAGSLPVSQGDAPAGIPAWGEVDPGVKLPEWPGANGSYSMLPATLNEHPSDLSGAISGWNANTSIQGAENLAGEALNELMSESGQSSGVLPSFYGEFWDQIGRPAEAQGEQAEAARAQHQLALQSLIERIRQSQSTNRR